MDKQSFNQTLLDIENSLRLLAAYGYRGFGCTEHSLEKLEKWGKGRAFFAESLEDIHADLGERGIRSALVDEVVEESGQDWYSLARDIRRKKFGAGAPADFKEKARQMRFLQYRGFGPDHIQAAVGDAGD